MMPISQEYWRAVRAEQKMADKRAAAVKSAAEALSVGLRLMTEKWAKPPALVRGVLLLFSLASGYLHGLAIDRYRGSGIARPVFISSLCVSLGLLCYYKYAGFFLATWQVAYFSWQLVP